MAHGFGEMAEIEYNQGNKVAKKMVFRKRKLEELSEEKQQLLKLLKVDLEKFNL